MAQLDRSRLLDYLRQLHEINIELVKAETFYELCHQIVIFGRERLGFDRLGLVRWDKESDTFRGTVNVNRHGEVIDQRAYVERVIDDPRIATMIEQGDQIRYWESITLTENGKPVGSGWFAVALLFDGENRIGWLATDNLIRKEPFSIEQIQ